MKSHAKIKWINEIEAQFDKDQLGEYQRIPKREEIMKCLLKYEEKLIEVFNTYKNTKYLSFWRYETAVEHLIKAGLVIEQLQPTQKDINFILDKYKSNQMDSRLEKELIKKMAKDTIIQCFDTLIFNDERIENYF